MTAPRRRICVMQIPSAKSRNSHADFCENILLARRAGAVSFGYFSLPPKKSNIQKTQSQREKFACRQQKIFCV